MKNERRIKIINWSVFLIFLVVGIVTIFVTFLDLVNMSNDAKITSQSRIEFDWNEENRIFGIILLILSILLILFWKRLFPFNVPVALIIMGLFYELFSLVYFSGWVGIQGVIGLAIATLTGSVMLIIYFLLRITKRTST